MITAFLSDIHGNLAALEATLEDLGKHRVDEVICLGDTVGYGPKPLECLDLMLSTCKISVLGNHDALVAFPKLDMRGLREDVADGVLLARNVLTDLHTEALREMPLTVRSSDAACVHASLADPGGFPYVNNRTEAERHFQRQTTRIGFFGHSHVPEAWEWDGTRVRWAERDGHELVLVEGLRYAVNAGSVGQPRDGDPRACYAIYNSAARLVQWHRVRYNIERTESDMLALGMSPFASKRLHVGM